MERVISPTLLVGAEQSGSTLLRLMLDCHPDIAFTEEFDYVVAGIGDDGSLPSPLETQAIFSIDRAFAASGFQLDPDLDYRALINGFLESRRRKTDAQVVGATLHHGFSRALHLWPDARWIRLVRDPRDVASARVKLRRAGNCWHGVEPWIQAEDEWTTLRPTLQPGSYIEVSFEELAQDHHSALSRVCRFLGVPYTGQMLDYTADTDYDLPHRRQVAEWSHALDPEEVRLVEARVGERLERAGYQRSGLQETRISDLRRTWLDWQNRGGTFLGRTRHVGIRLTMADLAARSLGHEKLTRSVQAKVNEAETRTRKKSWSDGKYRTSR
jgi:hypothetical protein